MRTVARPNGRSVGARRRERARALRSKNRRFRRAHATRFSRSFAAFASGALALRENHRRRQKGRTARRARRSEPRLSTSLPALPHSPRLRGPIFRAAGAGGSTRCRRPGGEWRHPHYVRRSGLPERPGSQPSHLAKNARSEPFGQLRFHCQSGAHPPPSSALARARGARPFVHRLGGRRILKRSACPIGQGPHPGRCRTAARHRAGKFGDLASVVRVVHAVDDAGGLSRRASLDRPARDRRLGGSYPARDSLVDPPRVAPFGAFGSSEPGRASRARHIHALLAAPRCSDGYALSSGLEPVLNPRQSVHRSRGDLLGDRRARRSRHPGSMATPLVAASHRIVVLLRGAHPRAIHVARQNQNSLGFTARTPGSPGFGGPALTCLLRGSTFRQPRTRHELPEEKEPPRVLASLASWRLTSERRVRASG